jgi:hypothetical protein
VLGSLGAGFALVVAPAVPIKYGQVPIQPACLSTVAAEDVLNDGYRPPIATFGFVETPAVLVEGAEVAKCLGDIEIRGAEGLPTDGKGLHQQEFRFSKTLVAAHIGG